MWRKLICLDAGVFDIYTEAGRADSDDLLRERGGEQEKERSKVGREMVVGCNV